MIKLFEMTDTSRERKKSKRVGRGPGCKKGKTCGRGHKGAGSRSGYKRRYGTEGGGIPLHMRLPKRGFKRGFVVSKLDAVNLWQISEMYSDGEKVTLDTLIQKSFLPKNSIGFKVLGTGELTKKVEIEADHISVTAKEKLEKGAVTYTILS